MRCTVVFAAITGLLPAQGRWIRLSVHNREQEAPNAPALGKPGTMVARSAMRSKT